MSPGNLNVSLTDMMVVLGKRVAYYCCGNNDYVSVPGLPQDNYDMRIILTMLGHDDLRTTISYL